MEAESKGVTFADAVREDKIVKEKLGNEKIEFCLNPENYVGHSEEIIDRVLDA